MSCHSRVDQPSLAGVTVSIFDPWQLQVEDMHLQWTWIGMVVCGQLTIARSPVASLHRKEVTVSSKAGR